MTMIDNTAQSAKNRLHILGIIWVWIQTQQSLLFWPALYLQTRRDYRGIGQHFCCCCAADIMGHLHSLLCSGLQKNASFLQQSPFWPFKVIQGRLFWYLLVGHSDYGPILHRFWDTATYWLKIAYFPLTRRPRCLFSVWNVALKLTMRILET